jgi:endonuclease/exonuclease/phosphatase (EEP) superfamily protein YafD
VSRRTRIAERFGLVNVEAIETAAEQAGLPFAVACALMEKESGGRNVYGHDAGGAGPHGSLVTEANFKAFLKAVLAGATSNGVGPAQITYAGARRADGTRDGGFFTAMKDRGLRPWVPVDNMRFGFELLAGYHAQTGSWVTAGERYNGARSYGEDLAKKIGEWRKRLERSTPDRSKVRTVAAWNMKVGRGKAAIDGTAGLIADHDPDVLLLQEAMNYGVRLRLRFGSKWRIYAGVPMTEAANCAVMVRRTIPRGRRGAIRNRHPWFYRGKGREVKKSGRVWRWVRVDGIHLLTVHRATEALGFNHTAGREEADNLENWFASHPGPMLAAGDWNNSHEDARKDSPAQIARIVKGELIVPEGARIDYALARDLTATAKRGGKYGSDHHSHIYTLKEN